MVRWYAAMTDQMLRAAAEAVSGSEIAAGTGRVSPLARSCEGADDGRLISLRRASGGKGRLTLSLLSQILRRVAVLDVA
jgi:hypothetical protein